MLQSHERCRNACWRFCSTAVLVVALLLILNALPASAATTDATSGTQRLQIQTVCFTVHNTGDPLLSTLKVMANWQNPP